MKFIFKIGSLVMNSNNSENLLAWSPPIRKIQEHNLFSVWKRPLGAIYFALVCKKVLFFVLTQIHFIGRPVIVNKQIS